MPTEEEEEGLSLNPYGRIFCSARDPLCDRYVPPPTGMNVSAEAASAAAAASTGLPVLIHDPSWTSELVLRAVTLVLLMLLTVSGNVAILVVLTCSRYRKLNSRVNIFIVNLAVGDLTVFCFTMTTEFLFVVSEKTWILGNVACKLILYLQIVTLASTTFILTAMSVDRYMAICKPLTFSSLTSRPGRMVTVSWLLAFLLASPQTFIFKQEAVGVYPNGEVKYRCASLGYTAWWQRKTYFTFLASYILVIPTVVISFCYINVVLVVWRRGRETSELSGVALRRTIRDSGAIPRAKMKTIKMTLSIILTFIVCWTPYFVVHLIHIWSEYRYVIPKYVYAVAETVAFLNSSLNPIIYGCFNIRTRRTRHAAETTTFNSNNEDPTPKKNPDKEHGAASTSGSNVIATTTTTSAGNSDVIKSALNSRTPLAGGNIECCCNNGRRRRGGGGYGSSNCHEVRRDTHEGRSGRRTSDSRRCFKLRVRFVKDDARLGREKVLLSELVSEQLMHGTDRRFE